MHEEISFIESESELDKNIPGNKIVIKGTELQSYFFVKLSQILKKVFYLLRCFLNLGSQAWFKI